MRVDTHIFSGARIPPFYDSLMAKIIVHAADRPTALKRMRTRSLRHASRASPRTSGSTVTCLLIPSLNEVALIPAS